MNRYFELIASVKLLKLLTNICLQVFHTVKALHLNAQQVSQYISTYAAMSSDFPSDKFQHLTTMLKKSEAELQSVITSVASGSGSDVLPRLFVLRDQYQNYLLQVRSMCQEIWAKFDLTSISLGLIIILNSVLLNVVIAVCWTGEGEELPGYFPFMIGGMVLQVVYYVVHVMVFPPTVPPIMGFVLGLVVIYALAVVLMKQATEVWKKSKGSMLDPGFASGVMAMYFAAFFSNSFVVYEDAFTHFLSQSLLWFIAVKVVLKCSGSPSHTSRDMASRLSRKSKHSSFVDILERITQPVVITFVVVVMGSLLLRFSAHFRACREEQWDCELSSFLQPLSSFAEDGTGYKNQRYFFSVATLFVTCWLARRWMQYYGNLNGDGLVVLCTKFIPPVGAIACALYWAIQALPPKELDALPPWQQTSMAQIVYMCVLFHVATLLFQPLLVFVYHSSPTSSVTAPLVDRGAEYAVPFVFRQLQQHWNKENPDRPPAAYGLGSVYSSSLVALASSVFLLLVLLLGDGMGPSLALAVGVLFVFMEIMSAYCAASKSDAGKSMLCSA